MYNNIFFIKKWATDRNSNTMNFEIIFTVNLYKYIEYHTYVCQFTFKCAVPFIWSTENSDLH